MEHIKPQATHTVDHGHEESDVNIRLIVAFGVMLIVSAVIIHVALWGMYIGLEKWHASKQPPPNPMMQATEQKQGSQATKAEGMPTTSLGESALEATRRLVATFPEPRLQADEVRDLEIFQENQHRQLEEYAWIDKASGRVRIPVKRAMELLAERGLPDAAPAATPAAAKPDGAAVALKTKTQSRGKRR